MPDVPASPPTPTDYTAPLDRQTLRRTLRQRRNAVPHAIAQAASRTIARQLARQLLKKGQRVAVYSAFDGEIDLAHFVRLAQRQGCEVYTPRIVNMRARRMEFIALPPQGKQKAKRLSILEPRINLHRRINPRSLDMVLLPLVAFDVHGWRLGFGAGFYDRKFGFLRRKIRHRPAMIGVGYEFQRVPPQNPSAWDVLLDAVVTERGLHRCLPIHTR